MSMKISVRLLFWPAPIQTPSKALVAVAALPGIRPG
jgi:hypothetical protein